MENTKRLVEISHRLSEITESLKASEPELFEELEALRAEKVNLIEKAKIELRDAGVGTHSIDGFKIKVAPGSKKRVYNAEDIQELAEELGHTDVLQKYKVFKVEIDPSQIERLPAEIKVHYQDLYTESEQSARVTLPKELQ
jgi:hypothetical protein